jgi:subtilase family serine protease
MDGITVIRIVAAVLFVVVLAILVQHRRSRVHKDSTH